MRPYATKPQRSEFDEFASLWPKRVTCFESAIIPALVMFEQPKIKIEMRQVLISARIRQRCF